MDHHPGLLAKMSPSRNGGGKIQLGGGGTEPVNRSAYCPRCRRFIYFDVQP